MTEIVYDPNQIDFDRPGKHFYEVGFHYDGTWGYALVPLIVINGARAGSPQAAIVCFGGTHGNEYEGQVAVARLAHELDPAEISGRVILIPRLNQPACAAGQRVSPLDGVNLNRAFPGNPRGTITYRIADFVTTRIFPQVDVVIDIHAAGRGAEFALCTSFHLVHDPDQHARMAHVAGLFDTPYILIYSQAMASGLLTDHAESLGKVTIGGEFGHSHGVSVAGVRHAYGGIKNVMRHYGLLEGEIERIDPDRPHPPRLVSAIQLDEYIPAPVTGVFEPETEVGALVETGQLLGRLYDFERPGDPPREIRAGRAGYVILQPFRAPIAKGDTMIVIAQEHRA